MKNLIPLLLALTAAPALAQVAPQLSIEERSSTNNFRRSTARDPSELEADKSVRIGCLAVGRIVSTMASDNVSVAEFGASTAASGSVNRIAFDAAISALPKNGGTILLPGTGNYTVTLPLTAAKRVEWSAPQGATVNGSASPEALGIWKSGPEVIEFTKGSGDANAFTFGPGSVRQLLQSGATGHFEAAHVEIDARSYGQAGKFIVGTQAIARTNSSGNVFGIAGYGQAQASAAKTAEVSGAEFNTEILAPVINRKTGVQIVDVATSHGYGLVHDAAIWTARQRGALGFLNGIQFGAGPDNEFALKNGTTNALLAVKAGSDVSVGYGLDANAISFAQAAIGLRAKGVGHRFSWGIGSNDNRSGGEIRSDASATAGKIIFVNGGVVAQSSTGIDAFTVLPEGVGIIRPVRVIETGASYSATTRDHLIVVRKTGGSATSIVLPAAPSKGNEITVKDGRGDASTNNITVRGGTIDGASSYVIAVNRGVVRLTFDGSEWVVL